MLHKIHELIDGRPGRNNLSFPLSILHSIIVCRDSMCAYQVGQGSISQEKTYCSRISMVGMSHFHPLTVLSTIKVAFTLILSVRAGSSDDMFSPI